MRAVSSTAGTRVRIGWKEHQRLVQAQGVDLADPVRVLDQGLAVGDDDVVDGVPVTAELAGQIRDRAATAADLLSDPPAGPVGHHQPGRPDRGHRLGDRPDRTARCGGRTIGACAHQAGRPPERRQVDELDGPAVLDPRRSVTARAPRSGPGLDMDAYRTIGFVHRAEHRHIAESDQQLADARVGSTSTGALESGGVENRQNRRALYRARDAQIPSDPKRRLDAAPLARRDRLTASKKDHRLRLSSTTGRRWPHRVVQTRRRRTTSGGWW